LPLSTVTVIVVSFNTRDLLRACLASVRAAAPCQTIVVDNASADGSAEMVRQEFPLVDLVASEENLGFVKANNLALGRATGQCALLLNPDAELTPGAVDSLASFLDAHAQAAVVGPRLAYADGSLQHSAFHFPTLLQTYFDFFPRPARLLTSGLNGRYPRRDYDTSLPFKVDFVLGAAMMVRRAAVEGVGVMDEGYFMYCEEVDWCWRFRRAGWSVWCQPESLVVHHEAQSSRQTRWLSYTRKWSSRFRFFGKYYPQTWQAANRWLVRLGLWAEARRAKSALHQGGISPEEYAERLAAFRQVAAMAAGRAD
jgi:hypothetical protein